MALLDSYATKAQLKARIGISDSSDDSRLDSALAAAREGVEGICGRQFNDAGSATPRIYYPDDLVTITVDDFWTTVGFQLAFDFSNAGVYPTIVAAANYQLEPLNGVVDGTPGWPFYRIHVIQTWPPLWWTSIGYPRTSIQVTAQWGWSVVPASVIEASLVGAEELYKLKDAPFGVAGFGQMGVVRVRENPKVQALLSRYIRYPIQVA